MLLYYKTRICTEHYTATFSRPYILFIISVYINIVFCNLFITLTYFSYYIEKLTYLSTRELFSIGMYEYCLSSLSLYFFWNLWITKQSSIIQKSVMYIDSYRNVYNFANTSFAREFRLNEIVILERDILYFSFWNFLPLRILLEMMENEARTANASISFIT